MISKTVEVNKFIRLFKHESHFYRKRRLYTIALWHMLIHCTFHFFWKHFSLESDTIETLPSVDLCCGIGLVDFRAGVAEVHWMP